MNITKGNIVGFCAECGGNIFEGNSVSISFV